MTSGEHEDGDAMGETPVAPMDRESTRTRFSLSIVLPCRNEEANVERVVRAAAEAGRRVSDDVEIIVVDDGSTDGTRFLAEELAQELNRPGLEVRIVRHEVGRGYGGAVRGGFAAATKDIVFLTDGDGQFDLNEITKLAPLLREYDIVAGYRITRRDPPARRLAGRAWTALMNALFGLHMRDIDCAFKLLPREMLGRLNLMSEGALISAEILARAKRLGYRIGQTGVNHYPRTAGRSTGGSAKVILRALDELIGLYGPIRKGMGDRIAEPGATSSGPTAGHMGSS